MSDEVILQKIAEWAVRVGENVALSRLTIRGVPGTTADTIVAGTYKKRPRAMLRKALIDVLKEEAS